MRDVCNCPHLLICANIRVAPRNTPATEKQFAEAQVWGAGTLTSGPASSLRLLGDVMSPEASPGIGWGEGKPLPPSRAT